MNSRTLHHSPIRASVNVCLLIFALSLCGCTGTARPANWALQAEGWTLAPDRRAYDPPCRPSRDFPRWEILAVGARYSHADFAYLGTGDGTLDLAPRSFDARAERFDMTPVKGRHRLTGIPTPLAGEIGDNGEWATLVRVFVRGGGKIDAQWLVRGESEAYGVDILGEPFRLPDNNVRLVHGLQAVAGVGSGRVGLRVSDELGVSRVDYGLNAVNAQERDAARALTSHGVIRVPTGDLIKVELPGPRLFGLPRLIGGVLGGAPIGYAFTVPAALLVSLKSILLSPVSRPLGGARVDIAPRGEPPRIGTTGVEDELLWIAVLPPGRTRLLWAVPPDDVHIEWHDDGRKREAQAVGRGDVSLSGPELIDPVAGARFYFKAYDLPSRFDLVINTARTLDGTATGPWVYNMKRRTRVRWNPVSVWRGWKCD